MYLFTNRTQPLLPYLAQIWSFRLLVLSLARRDWKIKYAQTFLGVLWSVIQPIVGLLIFTFFFERVIPIGDKIDYPYAIFAFSGMICWYYFSFNVTQGGTALLQHQDLIKKIYFPRIVLPLSKAMVGLADFFTALALLFILMLVKGYIPGKNFLFFPLFLAANIIVGLSVSIWLSALTIRYRDFNHIIPYLINFGIWLTPVFYPATLIPEAYAYFIYLNPVAGAIDGFRWCLIEGSTFPIQYWTGFMIAGILFVSGVIYFRKVENELTDWI
ncbi:MAG TPA: ABC transporter permease [Saprospiraceae bacterium]|nr:ABC transporter permease [Saprospiraceae bacterium]HMP24396.1 ABC transporter permease [Saprospiraceae bacterium]